MSRGNTSSSSSSLYQFLSSDSSQKRQKIEHFREIVGPGIADTAITDCLNATNFDLSRAVDYYYTKLLGTSSNPISLDDEAAPPPKSLPKPNFVECVCLGSLLCTGSLTTKLSAAANELYMDTPLDCSFSIKPPLNPSAYPNCPDNLINILHGAPIVRFGKRKNSEIGRLPAPISAALCPLVLLGLVEVYVAVGFPGCAGLNLNPGSSVPLRVDIALTPESMKRTMTTASDDLVVEKISKCWNTILREMHIGIGQEEVSEDQPETTTSSVADDESSEDIEMTEEMSKLIDVFAHPELPFMEPPKSIFTTTLKPYQAQALFWMADREYPMILNGGLPPTIKEAVRISGFNHSDASDPAGPESLPPGWTRIQTTPGETLFYNEGYFTFEKPPPVVDCRGGILADEMGLGKTVMTLSLISLDLLLPTTIPKPIPMFKSPNLAVPGGTLIVVHLSLLRQWIGELKRHAPNLSFIEFHGSDRTFDVRKLTSVTIVFSTYGTVAVDSSATILNQIAWRRIVLDEAHTIRTRSTKMSKAVSKLTAERRWCLTGTPLQNSIEDIYPLVAWLRVAPWRSYAYFRDHITLNYTDAKKTQALVTAQNMLKPIMLRRTKATKNRDGSPLVELPIRTNKIVEIELSDEEKDFYRALFWQTKLEFDKFEKSNQVMYNITHILQLLVRLRQALCHPLLCRTALKNIEPTLDPEVSTLDELLEKFVAKNTTSKEYLTNAIDDLKRIGIENIECPICLTEPCQFPVMTPCGHTLCRKCCISRLRQECPICRFVFTNSEIQSINMLTEQQSENTNSVCPPLSSKLRVLLDYIARDLRRGRRVIVFSQFVSFLEIISKVFLSKKIPFRTLHGGHNPNQREAAIEWLTNADIKAESYTDKTWLDEISANFLPDIEDDAGGELDQGRVLLVSLKAGGVGLNLVAANVVYLTDLWWNPSVEEQAFQRVHRLGQTRKVYTYKFVCSNTIDERILDLQNTKSVMTNDVLGDVASGNVPTTSNNSRKLTIEDIRQLFKPQ